MLREARSVEVVFNLTDLRAVLAGLDVPTLRSLAAHLPLDLRAPVLSAAPERETVLTRLLEAVLARSQIHSGGFLFRRFLFRRFLGSPLIKRDLLFRQQYHLYELEALLRAGDTEGRETEILAEYGAKGIGYQLQGRARLRFLLEL
ncbi:hypothetical protein [Ancylobacter sp. IITR112]|uniref:hypothetical protein n=1 Tax=Ancylobacter sp. IITR112 TaxID=3138073 RepID=UPI00352BC5F3